MNRHAKASQQRERLSELGKWHSKQVDDTAQRNRSRNEQARLERDEIKARRDQLAVAKEAKRQEEYAKKVAMETARTQEAERIIAEMADQEARMIDQLRQTQEDQKIAYEGLQASLQSP